MSLKPHVSANKYLNSVVIYREDKLDYLWYSREEKDGSATWQQMTKYSRHPIVLQYLRERYKPSIIKAKLAFNPRNFSFNDGSNAILSLHDRFWQMRKDGDDVNNDKYENVIVFASKKELLFTHEFTHDAVIGCILQPPHTAERVFNAIIEAAQTKFNGCHIWQFCDHIYPEALYIRGNQVEMYCGS